MWKRALDCNSSTFNSGHLGDIVLKSGIHESGECWAQTTSCRKPRPIKTHDLANGWRHTKNTAWLRSRTVWEELWSTWFHGAFLQGDHETLSKGHLKTAMKATDVWNNWRSNCCVIFRCSGKSNASDNTVTFSSCKNSINELSFGIKSTVEQRRIQPE